MAARRRRRRLSRLITLVTIFILFLVGSGAAWAYWSAGSTPGGGGASVATSVNQGATPTASVVGASVTVGWAASKLSNGITPVSGYTLQRYDSTGTTAQLMASCIGTITATTCTETTVPEGTWTYKVTPRFQTYWTGTASAASAALVVDTTPPSGGSVTISALTGTGPSYSRSTTLSLVLNRGTDANGFAAGARLWRATATLTSSGGANGVCGTLTAYATVGAADPSSPASVVAPDQSCVSYQYVVTDPSGNTATYTSATAKIDSTAPANPTFTTFTGSTATNTWWNGSSLFYRSNAATGSFTATATAADPASGILSYGFTSPGTNWTSSGGATSGVNTYSWSGTPGGSGASVTATNNAGGQSGSTAFTLVPDNAAPTGASVTPPTGPSSRTASSVAFTTGTDAGSGIGTRLLQRASVAHGNNACPTSGYSAFTTIFTNPASSPVADTVVLGNCYKYQYVVSDNVGNTVTVSNGSTLRVGTSYTSTITGTGSLSNYWRLGDTTVTLTDGRGTASGTYVNSPAYGQTGALAPDDPNTAVLFSGSQWASTSSVSLLASFSAELWFKSTSTAPAGLTGGACAWDLVPSMLRTTSFGNNKFAFGISLCNGKVAAGATDSKSTVSIGSTAVSDDNWHHVVFTRDATGPVALYLDGTLAGSSGGPTTNNPNNSSFYIAGTANGSTNFVGTLDEIAIYGAVLTLNEVQSHFYAGR